MTENLPPDFEQLAIAKRFDDVDREIAGLAVVCKVSLFQRETIDRVLHGDESVCGTSNPAAFRKLRDLLMMHYVMRERAMAELGAAEAQAVIDIVVGRIRERLSKLGLGPA